jgi:hypothetical protein
MKNKQFDAVEMVRKIRDANYEQTKQMTREERLVFYQQKGRQAQPEHAQLSEQISIKETPS